MAKEEKAAGELPEGVTAEMIKAWKERYGENKVKIATIFTDDNRTKSIDVIVRVPDRKTIEEFEKWVDKAPGKAKDIMIKACVLTRKDEIMADDDLYFSAFDAVAQLIPIRTSLIKNV